MITDEQIDEAFEVFLHSPELSSWESDLSYPEHIAARRLFRERVRDLLKEPEALVVALGDCTLSCVYLPDLFEQVQPYLRRYVLSTLPSAPPTPYLPPTHLGST